MCSIIAGCNFDEYNIAGVIQHIGEGYNIVGIIDAEVVIF